MFHGLHSTVKVVGVCTVSREEHTIAQTRELECTKIVLPEVISRGECTKTTFTFLRLFCIHRTECCGSCP